MHHDHEDCGVEEQGVAAPGRGAARDRGGDSEEVAFERGGLDAVVAALLFMAAGDRGRGQARAFARRTWSPFSPPAPGRGVAAGGSSAARSPSRAGARRPPT